MPAAEALAAAGLVPVELAAKEGLALINGTDGMLGMLVLAITDLRMLLRTADVAAAMSVEGQLGTDRVFAPELQASARTPARRCPPPTYGADGRVGHRRLPQHRRLQPGPGRLLPALLPAGPRRRARHRGSRRRQWPGASWLGDRQPGRVVDGRVESTATSTGPRWATSSTSSRSSPPTSPGSVSGDGPVPRPGAQRRTAPFLASDPGVDRGQMIAQYTQAAIVSELKRLAVPPRSTPSRRARCRRTTSRWAGAPHASCAARVDGLSRVVAVEVLTAARALDLRAPLTPSPATAAVVALLRESGIEGPGPDRHLSPEIEAAVGLVQSGAVLAAAEGVVGPLA